MSEINLTMGTLNNLLQGAKLDLKCAQEIGRATGRLDS